MYYKRIFVSLFFFLLINTIYCQDFIEFYRNQQLAEYYSELGKSDSAVFYYDKALSIDLGSRIYMPRYETVLKMVKHLIFLKDTITAIKSIEEACVYEELKYIIDSRFLKNINFEDFKKHNEWLNLECKCNNIKIDLPFNDSLRSVVEQLFTRGHIARMQGVSDDSLFHIDSLNIITLEQIIEKHGYPGINLIGYNTAYILLLHMPFEIDKKFFPIIKKEVFTGNIDPYSYAFFVDDALSDADKPQIYGMKDKYNWKDSAPAMIDIKTINKNRKEIGLISFEKQLELSKIKKENQK